MKNTLCLLLATIFSFNIGSHASFAANRSSAIKQCQVDVKSSKLALDQRDDLRLKCLKQKISQLNLKECLSIAQSMEYSFNAEDARMSCLFDLKKPISLNDCIELSKAMDTADSGDQVRWECIRGFNKTITKKQCRVLSRQMSYPANNQRADIYCSDEIFSAK